MKQQTEMPGTERPTNERLDELVEVYLERRNARMDMQDSEREARKALQAALEEEHGAGALEYARDGSPVYVWHDGETRHVAKLVTKTKVKVYKERNLPDDSSSAPLTVVDDDHEDLT